MVKPIGRAFIGTVGTIGRFFSFDTPKILKICSEGSKRKMNVLTRLRQVVGLVVVP